MEAYYFDLFHIVQKPTEEISMLKGRLWIELYVTSKQVKS